MKKSQRLVLTIFAVISIFCILLLILGARYRNDQSKKITQLNNGNTALINTINKQLNLPYEKPIVITVYNPADFSDGNLVGKLYKDDKILLYIKSNEAVVYRPSENKVISIVSARAILTTTENN